MLIYINENDLLKLLLEENTAAWNRENWASTNKDIMKYLWVNYLLSLNDGKRYEVYNNDFELDEASCCAFDDLLVVLAEIIND